MFFMNKKRSIGLGIDIGTKVIKAVEISKKNKQFFLENYGEIDLDFACEYFFRSFNKKDFNPDVENISKALSELLKEAKFKSNFVVFSLPDFSTFFATFEMPPMSKKEIDSAIYFEARKYIPLPLSDIVLDWQSMENKISEKDINNVLVMAVSKNTINNYQKIAENIGLKLSAVEPEAISLKRSFDISSDENVCLVEIGFQSTNISLIKNGCMVMSFSFDLAGKNLTEKIVEALEVETSIAEKLKRKYGLTNFENFSGFDILEPIVSEISEKIGRVISEFEKKEKIVVPKIIFSGGTSLMSGFLDYLNDKINSNRHNKIILELGRPFDRINYPKELEERMVDINANYAIALGEALKNFDK
jgi:type IV pilus assembly protein PilM